MSPFSTVGARSASLPTGVRVITSDVMRPLVWISLAVTHPPAEDEIAVMAIGVMTLTPKTIVLVRAGGAAGAAPPPGLGRGVAVGAHAEIRIRAAKTNMDR